MPYGQAALRYVLEKSGLPSKRKLEPVRDPTEIYKSAKLSPNGHSSRHARVDEDENDEDDTEAGPARPPPEDDEDGDYGPARPDEDDGVDDEEGGRFFGGGITRQEAEVLDYLDDGGDGDDTAAPEKIDSAWLRRTALSLEKRINKNAELRARFEAQPAKFIDSEAELDAEVRALSILADHPALYPEFAALGTAASLASLLAHDNTDVAISAAQIVGELTAEDNDAQATEEQWGALADALLEADVVGLLVGNLGRLDEDGDEADRSGVYYCLAVVENLCSRAATAEQIARDEPLLKWLLQRIQKSESSSSSSSSSVSQNKQYAAEILAILAQSSPANRAALAALDAVDAMLQLVAPYRRRDPEKGSEEEEYVADLFEALTCVVDDAEAGKPRFVEAEGVELCLIMVKEGKSARPMALRLLDHAVSGPGAAEVCMRVVEAGGLKTLFTAFMSGHKKKQQQQHEGQVVEHLVGIFAWMLRLLPADSAERVRALAKFVEKEYEKTARLWALRRRYAARVAEADARIEEEKGQVEDEEDREAMAAEWFSRRLDAGLYCLQTIDVILAWLVAEDDGARRKIRDLLADQDQGFEVLRTSLQEQIDGIDVEDEGGQETREMLSTLVEFLQ
ncbi:uncharacterized protein E0L32_012384 [Thyridium curvatum]|uniref:Beta-catenin-like protein 1 N-terminal domain-containing protein n=1 Tax=Thyridium curvatum TaxID=1093900 RepID=A0A507BJJ3_9PEZI|nr:uncharacterized protein E0L32_012384 [Thyridium curvatum]TPX16780.1 hypothetical protein E0L32_012384 [Thyridium curvatum]